MKNLILALLLVGTTAFGITSNKVWRVPSSGSLGAWGPVNLADGTNAITGALASKNNLPAVGQQLSSSSGSFTTTSATIVDITNLTVTITTVGRPVMLMLIDDGSGSQSKIQTVATGGNQNVFCVFYFDRAGSNITTTIFGRSEPSAVIASVSYPPSSFTHFDPVAAGTYTYKARINTSNAQSCAVSNVKLLAYEL